MQLKKIVRTIVNVILCFLIILGLVFTLPKIAGIKPYIVLSGSMEPALSVGAVIFTDTGRTIPEKGDIITYEVKGNMITHRVVQIEEDGYITKGDANVMKDPKIAQEQVEGTVLFSIPYLGYAAIFTQNKGFLLLLAALVLLSYALDNEEVPGKQKTEKQIEGRGDRDTPEE